MSKLKVKKKIEDGLSDISARIGRYRAFSIIRPGMQKMVAQYPELREKLRNIKQYSINNLEDLLDQAVKSLEEKGCKVFIAESEEAAVKYIGEIVKSGLVVKSKSNAGKEIDITKYLEKQEATVIETDLGDRINQLAKSNASHSLAPAIHIPIERVTELFSAEAGKQLACDENELVKAARKSLRKFLEDADVGISGANAVVAETGSIFLTENEGNIRAVTSMPKIHIAIAGIEKIVPKLNDGITVVKSAATFGVGQDIGTYISVISGPSRYTNEEFTFLGSGQGPEEVHVVFLRGGRKEAIDEGFEESLYCINCGSCLNFCPVYGEIGDKYGYKYLGGRGTVFSAFHGNIKKAQEAGLFLCIGCQKCLDACAVRMKTPEMITSLRAKVVKEQGMEWAKKHVFDILADNKLPRYVKLVRSFQDLGLKRKAEYKSATMRFNIENLGLPSNRLVPTIADKNFIDTIKNRKPINNPKMKVAFFAGCMVNYIKPELGVNLLDILEAEGIEVKTYEKEVCCGLPAIMSGGTTQAFKLAKHNVELFTTDDSEYLLFVCPSCATTVKKEWSRILENEADKDLLKEYNDLAKKVIDINEFFVKVLDLTPNKTIDAKVTYHDPCHLVRGLGIKNEPRQLLSSIPGIELIEMEDADSCCGFGGSFSLFYYDLAKKINDEKIKKITATDSDFIVTSCPGCMMHIDDGIHRAESKQKVVHMIELLAKAYKGGDKK